MNFLKSGFLIVLFTGILASSTLAQEENPWIEKIDWAFELSGTYNFSYLELDDVKDEVNYQKSAYDDYIAAYPESYKISGTEDFGFSPMFDFKVGLRYRNYIGGINFSSTFSNESSFNVAFDFEDDTTTPPTEIHRTDNYNTAVSTKEYLFYLGYLYPVHDRLDLVILGAYGLGSSEAQIKFTQSGIDRNGFPYIYSEDHTLKGDYYPYRFEGHIRYNLTRFVDLDLSMGYRVSKPTGMSGDLKSWYNGQENNPDFDVIAIHHLAGGDEEELLFDYSGMFYGIGITLKNPIEKKE